MQLFKKLFTSIFILLFTGCSSEVELPSYVTTYELSMETAQELSEGFLLALDEDPESTKKFVYDTLENGEDVLQLIVEHRRFQTPHSITVTQLEHGEGTLPTGEIFFRTNAIGTFTCEGSDHASDFDLMWMYNEKDNRWELLSFNLEAC
ncbi:hypothetical protein IPG41_04970 [Candidatus Peregrinibacteria bacterium]|nr:MAG: hypothetical protein IPG41_04970 [Candidatus Peregrinibacteria bacterium]